MLVYRIEQENGTGVYQDCRSYNRPNAIPLECSGPTARHPLPDQDGRLAPQWLELGISQERHRWYFGFASQERMLAWFYEDAYRAELAELGFGLAVYEVATEHVRFGYTQCVFRRQDATRREFITEGW